MNDRSRLFLAFAALVALPPTAHAQTAPVTPPPAAKPPAEPAAPPANGKPAPAQSETGTADTAETANSKDEEADAAKAEAAKTPDPAAQAAPAAPPSPAATPAPSPNRPPKERLDTEAPAPDDGQMGSHRDHWLGTFGVRVGYIANEGYDPFSENDVLIQTSLGFGRTVYSDGPLSVVGLLIWDQGPTEATARGGETNLATHRFTLGGETRYHFIRRFYAFGRLAPGALRWDATLSDRAAGVKREADGWMFALDLSAGASVEFAGEARGESPRPRAFFSAEGGYGWSTTSEVSFGGDEPGNAPARLEPLALNELGVRGAFFRVAAALTY